MPREFGICLFQRQLEFLQRIGPPQCVLIALMIEPSIGAHSSDLANGLEPAERRRQFMNFQLRHSFVCCFTSRARARKQREVGTHPTDRPGPTRALQNVCRILALQRTIQSLPMRPPCSKSHVVHVPYLVLYL